MLTHRMMLGAGALALALSVAACSEDRGGGATGVSSPDFATVGAAPSVPSEVAVPGNEEPNLAGPDEGVSFVTDGHQYRIQVVSGGTATRITQDGAPLLEFGGTPVSVSSVTSANVTLFSGGQAIYSDIVSLQGIPLALIRPAKPNTPGGPMRQQMMPCMTELAAFGAAAGYLSIELAMEDAAPGSVSLRELWRAATAVVATGALLYRCLHPLW